MNETTNLNSELLSADARGRKHIPFAVFAVIVIHVVLFLVLLIAAGCRAKARARRNAQPSEAAAVRSTPSAGAPSAVPQPLLAAVSPVLSNSVAPANSFTPATAVSGPVVATEPPLEKQPAPPALRKSAQKASSNAGTRPSALHTQKAKIYVVKAGDTVEKIAKMHRTSVQAIKTENNLKDHLLRPGQQLRVSSQKTKTSNEV